MLDVKQNRLDYGELLIPPPEYRLNRAIATTYSLDLNTLLSIPIALHFAQTLEGNVKGNEIHLLHAISETARKLTIYHQAGQIKVPDSACDLFAYYEEALVPIQMPDPYAAFHPKTWLLRFEHAEDPQKICYRLMVLSRNLTFDRSWDVATYFDGVPRSRPISRTKPLVDFHQWLCEQGQFPDSDLLLKELANVEFEVPEPYDTFAFHPIGIPGYANPIPKQTADQLLCISPFLHQQAIDTLWENVQKTPQILSRRDSLLALPAETIAECECYALSDLIVDGEHLEGTETEGDVQQAQDLHAKVFIYKLAAKKYRWFLGSANATQAAFHKNVECMVRLDGRHHSLSLATVRSQLLGEDGEGAIFERVLPGDLLPKNGDSPAADLRRLVHAILGAPMSGNVTRAANEENYRLEISVDLSGVQRQSGITLSAGPLVRGVTEKELLFGQSNTVVAENVNETSLTRFLCFTLEAEIQTETNEKESESQQFVVRVDVEGIPNSRDRSIMKSLVDSEEKFFRYLRFLLEDDVKPEDIQGEMPLPKEPKGATPQSWSFDLPIFENLLAVASREPARLAEIDRTIKRLQDEDEDSVIPQDFLHLWSVFRGVTAAHEVADE
jgi:hypothetical protein